MTRIIDDYLNDIRRRLSHLGLRERDAVLEEIRLHLESEVARLRSEDKRLSKDEGALQATNSFGDPEEIGVAYGAHGGVINRTTGEMLLEVALLTTRAAGRGLRGTLKWTGIVLAIILGISLILVLAGLVFADNVIDTFQDDIRQNTPHPLYDYDGVWLGTENAHTETTMDSFQVRQGVREFTIDFRIQPLGGPEPTGCAQITLTDPDGSVAYDSGTDCDADSRELTLNQQGTWQVRYTYVAFQGSVDVEAYYFEEVSSQP